MERRRRRLRFLEWAMSPLHPEKPAARGFTLIEVTLASFVLAIGLLSAGLLAGKMIMGTNRSKYMSVASKLASEKLEDVNRRDTDVLQVCGPTGCTMDGSLTVVVK